MMMLLLARKEIGSLLQITVVYERAVESGSGLHIQL
jgi:hypothetical protein